MIVFRNLSQEALSSPLSKHIRVNQNGLHLQLETDPQTSASRPTTAYTTLASEQYKTEWLPLHVCSSQLFPEDQSCLLTHTLLSTVLPVVF